MRYGSGGEADAQAGLAPVIPIFGGTSRRRASDSESGARGTGAPRASDPRAGQSHAGDLHARDLRPGELQAGDLRDGERQRAEELLVRRLRSRALSVVESRAVLSDGDVSLDVIDEVIAEFVRRRYIDDRTLAEHLVTSGVERKGQGRLALSRSLAQRGIPHDVIDEALEALPEDDRERALEFARRRASSMTDLEYDTALRRLLGQLARRGFAGSDATDAARTALREAGIARGARSGVRFVESD